MKLWLLEPIGDGDEDYKDTPWEIWYDSVFGFVIRAETEQEARQIADSQAGDENKRWLPGGAQTTIHPWLDPEQSTCVELLPDGEPGVILRDMHWA